MAMLWLRRSGIFVGLSYFLDCVIRLSIACRSSPKSSKFNMNSLSYRRRPHSSCIPNNLKSTLNPSSHAPIQSLSLQSRPVYQNPATPIIDKQFCGLTKHRKQNEERKLKELTHGQYKERIFVLSFLLISFD